MGDTKSINSISSALDIYSIINIATDTCILNDQSLPFCDLSCSNHRHITMSGRYQTPRTDTGSVWASSLSGTQVSLPASSPRWTLCRPAGEWSTRTRNPPAQPSQSRSPQNQHVGFQHPSWRHASPWSSPAWLLPQAWTGRLSSPSPAAAGSSEGSSWRYPARRSLGTPVRSARNPSQTPAPKFPQIR